MPTRFSRDIIKEDDLKVWQELSNKEEYYVCRISRYVKYKYSFPLKIRQKMKILRKKLNNEHLQFSYFVTQFIIIIYSLA